MLKLSKVYRAIEAKRSLIENFDNQSISYLNQLIEGCHSLKSIDFDDYNERVLDSEEEFIGGLATRELSERGLIFDAVESSLISKEDVAEWKKNILEDRIVFASDGSQIEADKNLNMFLGAIQVAYFVNFHNREKEAIKDLDFELVLPSEVSEEEDELRQKIAFERFAKEVRALIDLIKKVSSAQTQKIPIGFFDGSLTISFIHNKTLKKKYLGVVSELIENSEKYRIPIVGYIDTSLASNLTKSLEVVLGKVNCGKIKINDATLLKSFMNKWGSRSSYFRYFDKTASDEFNVLSEIGFCYLKTSSKKSKPSRLEIPYWVYKDGLHDEVISTVLAECLVGNGYPYSIEVADSMAVIRQDEKEVFYKVLQNSLSNQLDLSNKLKSKLIRRKSNVVV
ncbi:MAG: DNA double-strand break repair nuclease NurA [Candidatus Caenarcaniphilales bacterium]|nr:DNA double-strand break repair nuclease NurA [Candidatus Caenarcaniphilales bacterium]